MEVIAQSVGLDGIASTEGASCLKEWWKNSSKNGVQVKTSAAIPPAETRKSKAASRRWIRFVSDDLAVTKRGGRCRHERENSLRIQP